MVECVIAEDEELLRTALAQQLGQAWPAPTSSAPTRPGPAVYATPSRSAVDSPASARVWRTSGSSLRTWSRLASSGTTPPYSACRAIWL